MFPRVLGYEKSGIKEGDITKVRVYRVDSSFMKMPTMVQL